MVPGWKNRNEDAMIAALLSDISAGQSEASRGNSDQSEDEK